MEQKMSTKKEREKKKKEKERRRELNNHQSKQWADVCDCCWFMTNTQEYKTPMLEVWIDSIDWNPDYSERQSHTDAHWKWK